MKHEVSYKWADSLNDSSVDEIIHIINQDTPIYMVPVVHRKLDNTVNYYELRRDDDAWALNSKEDLLQVVASHLSWLNEIVSCGLIVPEA